MADFFLFLLMSLLVPISPLFLFVPPGGYMVAFLKKLGKYILPFEFLLSVMVFPYLGWWSIAIALGFVFAAGFIILGIDFIRGVLSR